jgi:hypothetical protein
MRGENIKIKACIHCGSQNLRSGAAVDGIVPGDAPFVFFCNDCENKGTPIIFDSEEDYNKFKKALKE